MANYFQSLENQTLETILQCTSCDELNAILGNHKNELIAQIPYHHYLESNTHSSIQPLEEALEIAVVPIDVLWIIVSFISLGVATLWILGSVGFTTGGLFLGGYYYYAKQQDEKIAHEKDDLEITGIKIQAVDELLNRHQSKNLNIPTKKIDDIKVSYKKSIILGVSFASILGFTYWGVTDILLTLEIISAASLLTGPIGLGIAVGVAILFGVGLAIHHYHIQKKNAPIKSLKKILHDELNEKQISLNVLKQIENVKKTTVDNINVQRKESENKYESKNNPCNRNTLQTSKMTSQNFRFFKEKISTNIIHRQNHALKRSFSF